MLATQENMYNWHPKAVLRSMLHPLYASTVPAIDTSKFDVPKVPFVKPLPFGGGLPSLQPNYEAFTADGISRQLMTKGHMKRTKELPPDKKQQKGAEKEQAEEHKRALKAIGAKGDIMRATGSLAMNAASSSASVPYTLQALIELGVSNAEDSGSLFEILDD